jgi:hypothetical protein
VFDTVQGCIYNIYKGCFSPENMLIIYIIQQWNDHSPEYQCCNLVVSGPNAIPNNPENIYEKKTYERLYVVHIITNTILWCLLNFTKNKMN